LVVTYSLQHAQQSSAEALANAQLELGRINAERDRKVQESRLTADLLNHLLSTDSAHRQIAIIALRETVTTTVSDNILAVLAQRDSDSSVRATAIRQLGTSSDRGVAQQLSQIAADPARSTSERALATRATGSIAYNSAAGQNVLIMAATGANGVAFESAQLKHGMFTYALLEGLNGLADIDNDKRITVGELSTFVRSRTAELSDGKMNPTFSNTIASEDDAVLPRPGKIVSLSIGNDRYASPNIPSLQFSCNDAQAFNRLLADKWGQRREDAISLCGAAATRVGILSAISKLAAVVDQSTSVFVYISGHGFVQDGTAYLVPYDGTVGGVSQIATALSLIEIRRYLENLKASRVFWFIDAAHSGAAVEITR
jgi:uncharacterized caspase-like protein